MKKSVLLALVLLLLTSYPAMGGEEKLSLQGTASSVYSTSYGPEKTLDGYYETYWVGKGRPTFGSESVEWYITFELDEVTTLGYVTVTWYGDFYGPQDYKIELSDDGLSWITAKENITPTFKAGGDKVTIDQPAKYIKLYTDSAKYFPVLSEFEAYSKGGVIPHLIRFQGTIGDGEKIPLQGEVTLNITFKLYNTEVGGTPLWAETQNLTIEDALLDVELGSITPLDLAFDTQYYLGVEVEQDGEMTPRFKLTSVPYAFTSEE